MTAAARYPNGYEQRAAVELRATGRTLEGYASVWNSPAQLPGFVETVAKGAFAASLRSNPDILMLLNHDPSQVLARTRNGSLALQEDARGLRFTATAPRTTLGDDVLEAVRSGLMGGVSVGFRCASPGGDHWSAPDRRELRQVDLLEISACSAFAAYPATTINARFRAASVDPRRVRSLFLETL